MKHVPPRTLALTLILALAIACARGSETRDPSSDDVEQEDDDVDAPDDDGEDDDDADVESKARDDGEDAGEPAEEIDAGRVYPDAGAAADAGADAGGVAFSFAASNVDPASVDLASAPAAVLDCGLTRVDTSDPVRLDNWCGTKPTPLTRAQVGGPELLVLALDKLSVAAGSSLVVTGSRPLVLLLRGDADIRGAIDVSANASIPGPGGDLACGASTGGDGVGEERDSGGGGGGGGFGTAGGGGGDDRGDDSSPGAAGLARAGAELVPLFAGCAGGHGGGCAGEPGAGGGALQITAGGALVVHGTLRADGGDGAEGCADDAGGTGGGSGGAFLLEANTIDLTGATLSATGGDGGPGQRRADPGLGAQTPKEQGGAGEEGNSSGGGGGGGGYGKLKFHAATTCTGCPTP